MDLRPLSVIMLFISLTQVGQARAVKPVLSVQPNSSQIFRGETVTLTCTIPGRGPYIWYRDGDQVSSTDYYVYSVKIYQSHKYTCYGSNDGQPTKLSNEVTLSVTERPKAVVTRQPDGQIFSGERITFTCEIQGHEDTEWTYTFYQNNVSAFDTEKRKEYSFSALETDSGKYTCRGQRKSDSQTSVTSNIVTLTVSEKPEVNLTSDLEGPALTGSSVTLYCTLNVQSAGWRFYWRKDEQSNETETETHSYTIRLDSVSDGGQYSCRAGRGNPVYYTHYSDALWVNVTDPGQNIILVAVGVSSALLFIILLLIVLWCCRYKSSKGRNNEIQQHSNLTPGQNPGAEESQSGHTPHQPDEDADVTYIELKHKPKDKSRKNQYQVKTNDEPETVYSELKQNS